MIYNELLQWAVLGLLFYRVVKHEQALVMVSECFEVLNKLVQSVKDAVDDDDKQN